MLKRRSSFERCVTLPVGTSSVARKQSFRCVSGHVHNLTTSYFERKETKFVGNKTAIYCRNRSSVCLLFVKLALVRVFSSFIRPITYTTASREHASDASSSAKPEPQQRRQCEGANVRQKNPSPQTLRFPLRFVSVLWVRHAQLRDLVEVWAVTGECSPPVRECLPPDRNRPIFFFFVQTFVDFALSFLGHSLWVFLPPGPWIFLRNDKYGQEEN